MHGMPGFGLGYLANLVTGFPPGGVVLCAVMEASSSEMSGRPTPRAALPRANQVSRPLWMALAEIVFAR